MLKKVADIFEMARNIKPKKIVCIAADDEDVIDAIHDAIELGMIEATLIGPMPRITEILLTHQYSMDHITIIDCDNYEFGSEQAMRMVHMGRADIIMKGLVDTRIVLKAVVNKEYGIREAAILNHVGLASFSHFNRVLFFTDGAMLIAPTVEERIQMIQNAVAFMHLLGYEEPKVGLVSAVEKVNPKMQSTVDAASIVEQYQAGRIKGCIVDGPFAIDNLVSVVSSVHKGILSPVGGWCDLMVFPTIEAGNVFYKTIVHLAKADVAGIILGSKVPIVLTSRSDSRQAKLNSIVLSCLVSERKK
jgi:phosphate butyryltransferase